MIVDLFNELQRPGPTDTATQSRVFADALEQAELADRLGYGCWWSVEHHCTPEFSHSGAPELMNAAIAMRTSRLRVGQAGVLTPFRINHPLRAAERVAVLDHLSGGRTEVGLARSGGAEWATFGIDGDATLAELEEAARLMVTAWTAPEFSWSSERLEIPSRTLVPHPVQRPHPRLWQTVSSPGSFRMAGRLGLGVLCTTLLSPVSVLEEMLAEYDAGRAEATDIVGCEPNDQRAVFTFVHCTDTLDEAIASRAAEAAMWYVNAAPKVFAVPRKIWTNLIRGNVNAGDSGRGRSALDDPEKIMVDLDPDDPNPIIRLMNRQVLGHSIDPLEAYEALADQDSVIIGDVATCRRKIEKYRDVGFDRLMCLMQFGHLDHDQAMASIRRVGEELIPAFDEGDSHMTDMSDRLTGQVVIVSGSAGGQGAAEVRLLAAQGARVMVADVDDAAGQAVADDIGDSARYHHLDVRSEADWRAALGATETAFGSVTGLVNNAGVSGQPTPIVKTSVDDYRDLIEINQIGAFTGVHVVAPAIVAAGGGSIVNVSSVNGFVGAWGIAGYVSSKFALRGLTKVAALELARKGVRVNSVHPGPIDTPMLAGGMPPAPTRSLR